MPNYLIRETLATFIQKGATCCHFKKNQIILYGSHVPMGIFIITSGKVLVYGASSRSKIGIERYFICDEKVLILPSMQDLNRQSSIQAKALRNCKALFVPRSIVLNDKSLFTQIEEWMLNVRVEWDQGSKL